MPIFYFLFHFLGELSPFDPFWAPVEQYNVTGGIRFWIFLKMKLDHWISHAEMSINANFQLFIPFSWEVINIWPFLGHRWTLWRHRWVKISKIFKNGCTIEFLTKISLNANLWSNYGFMVKFSNIFLPCSIFQGVNLFKRLTILN